MRKYPTAELMSFLIQEKSLELWHDTCSAAACFRVGVAENLEQTQLKFSCYARQRGQRYIIRLHSH